MQYLPFYDLPCSGAFSLWAREEGGSLNRRLSAIILRPHYTMFTRTFELIITFKVTVLSLAKKLKPYIEKVHDIALIHAIIITIIVSLALYATKTAESSERMAQYLHDSSCALEASDAFPLPFVKFQKECLHSSNFSSEDQP